MASVIGTCLRDCLHPRLIRRGRCLGTPNDAPERFVEAWRGGRQPSLARLLAGCETETLTEDRARAAGILRRGVAKDVGAIDATVAEIAIRVRAAVVTSDRVDLERFAESARRRLGIIDI